MYARLHLKVMLQLLLSLISVMMFCQCGNERKINMELDKADELLNGRPDSSYSILQSLDTTELDSRRNSARYALLKAMAIDKMGIDTTNTEILRPAIDFFIKKGNPDEKLRTYYYLGRIYQNQGNYEAALGTFIRGKELQPYITDSLVLGYLLVAESAILSKLPKYDQMLTNQIQAAELFRGTDRKDYEILSWAKALNLCVYIHNQTKGDSVYQILSDALKLNPDMSGRITPYILSYLITFGSPEMIKQAVEEAQNLDNINDWTLKDIALGYNTLGDNVKAKQWLDSIPMNGEVINQPLYYLLKTDILEGLGNYKEALQAHRQLLEMVEKDYEATSKHDIYFSQERYETEIENLNAIRKRERIIWGAIVLGLMLLFVAISIFRRYRTTKKENQEQEKEIKHLRVKSDHDKEQFEKERQIQAESMAKMKRQIAEMEEQTAQLNELLNQKQALAPEVAKAIRDRLQLLNGMLATHISQNDKLAAKFIEERDKLINNKEEFVKATRLAFGVSNPKFIKYLEEQGLNEAEINQACLYAMGMNGKTVGTYLAQSRHYHISSDIRRKLGLPENSTNLSIHIRKLLAKDQENEDQ